MIWHRPKTIGGARRDERVLTVGLGKQYATLDDALADIATLTWKSSGAMTGTISVVAGSATATGSGTAWLSEVKPNDYITIGAYTEPVKSVESDTELTLWSGSRQTVSGSAATIRKINPYKIRLYGRHTINVGAVLPSGVSLDICGAPGTGAGIDVQGYSAGIEKRITVPTTHAGRLSVEGLSLAGDRGEDNPLVFGGIGGLSRGIFNFHSCQMTDSHGPFLLGGASLTITQCDLLRSRWNFSGDYLMLEDVYQHGDAPSLDWGLLSPGQVTDIGHPVIYNRVRIHNDVDPLIVSMNGGFEHNNCPAGKRHYFTNSEFISTGSKQPDAGALVDYSNAVIYIWYSNSDNGEFAFIDCIIESPGMVGDIYSTSPTNRQPTLIRTYRQDGVTPSTVFGPRINI